MTAPRQPTREDERSWAAWLRGYDLGFRKGVQWEKDATLQREQEACDVKHAFRMWHA